MNDSTETGMRVALKKKQTNNNNRRRHKTILNTHSKQLENYIFMYSVAVAATQHHSRMNEMMNEKKETNPKEMRFLQLNANKQQNRKNLRKNVIAIKYEV